MRKFLMLTAAVAAFAVPAFAGGVHMGGMPMPSFRPMSMPSAPPPPTLTPVPNIPPAAQPAFQNSLAQFNAERQAALAAQAAQAAAKCGGGSRFPGC